MNVSRATEAKNESASGRLFFALAMQPAVADRVKAFQESVPLDGRLVPSRQFHVTLAYIGVRPQGTITRLLSLADQVEFSPCKVILDRPGQFRRSQVGWLGANQVPAGLEAFRERLAMALDSTDIGFDNKPWKFHVTLYRKLRKPLPIMPPVAIEWPLDRYSLVESVSVKGGVEYREISHWPKAR